MVPCLISIGLGVRVVDFRFSGVICSRIWVAEKNAKTSSTGVESNVSVRKVPFVGTIENPTGAGPCAGHDRDL